MRHKKDLRQHQHNQQIISPNEARRQRKAEKQRARIPESSGLYEDGMTYEEVCRLHLIGNPEDLDSALYDYELLAKQFQFYTQIAQPVSKGGLLYCPNCDNRVTANDKYCSACGRRTGWRY